MVFKFQYFLYTFFVIILWHVRYRRFSSTVIPSTSFDCPHSLQAPPTHKTAAVDSFTIGTSTKKGSTSILARHPHLRSTHWPIRIFDRSEGWLWHHLPPYWYQFTTPHRWTFTWSPAPWFAASWSNRVRRPAATWFALWAWIPAATRAPSMPLWSIWSVRAP